MRRVWSVVRREYLERVRSRGFIMQTVAIPLIGIVLIGSSAALSARGQQARRELALVDLSGYLADAVQEGLEDSGYEVEVAGRGDLAALDARVEEGDLFGYLVLDDLTVEEGVAVFRGKEPLRTLSAGLVRATVVQAVLEVRLASASDTGGEVGTLLRGGTLEFESVSGDVEQEEQVAATVVGLIGTLLLYAGLLVYGSFVLRSVLEEKRNRVVEIVISSIRPGQLMLGKILGVGAVGLTQMSIWIGSFFLIALIALPSLVAFWPVLEEVGDLAQYLPGLGTVFLFGVYFVLGFLLYSGLFAAVGAICTREEEANQAQFPIMMLLVFPLILQTSAIEGAGFPWLDWAALFPFFSPILMFPRAAAGQVPPWMILASILLMVAALVATAWVAGRIYRVGILMQGKRPTVPEILRWVREA